MTRTPGGPRQAGYRVVAAGVALAAVLLPFDRSRASEQSERLYSRGLVFLQEGKTEEALASFEAAVAADPNDATALFYRGVARGRLNDLDGAVADLSAAAERDPKLHEAALELGVALVQREQYAGAVPWLERARKVPELEGQASLFLGIAQLRLGERVQADESFRHAAEVDESLRVPATYYRGVIAYQQRRWDEAGAFFDLVVVASPETDMGREAQSFLVRLGAGARPYLVYGGVGFEYDSNVTLAPADETVDTSLGVSGQADGRATIEVGGIYRPLQTPSSSVSVGYEFFQGLQFDLTDFNLQDHRVHAEGSHRWENVEVDAAASYDFYLRDGDTFLQQVNFTPSATYLYEDRSATILLYRFRWNDYLEDPFTQLLTAYRHDFGFRQIFYLGSPSRMIIGGYQYEIQDMIDAAGAPYAYHANILEAGFGWDLPWSIGLQALYAYMHQNYAAASDGRVDDDHRGLLVLARPMNEYLIVRATFYADVNDSNQPSFSYDRYVGGISAEVRY